MAVKSVVVPLIGEGGPWNPEEHGNRPEVTALGVWLLRLADIDGTGSKFFSMVRCVYKMHVPHLATLPVFKKQGSRTYYDPAVVGEYVAGRQLEWNNGIEVDHMPTQFYGDNGDQIGLLYHLDSDPSNVLEMEVKYSGTFKHTFDLRAFPYDKQLLPMNIKIWNHNDIDAKRIWVPLDREFAINKDDLTFPDWNLDFKNLNLQITDSRGGNCSARFGMLVTRKPWFHFIAATMPLFFVVAIALTTFAIELEDRSDRIGHAVTLLLSAVAVKFVITADVPRVAYATRIDWETLLTYAFLLSLTFMHALVADKATDRIGFLCALAFAGLIAMVMALGPISFLFNKVQ